MVVPPCLVRLRVAAIQTLRAGTLRYPDIFPSNLHNFFFKNNNVKINHSNNIFTELFTMVRIPGGASYHKAVTYAVLSYS